LLKVWGVAQLERHWPLSNTIPVAHVKQLAAEGPEQVRQLELQSEGKRKRMFGGYELKKVA